MTAIGRYCYFCYSATKVVLRGKLSTCGEVKRATADINLSDAHMQWKVKDMTSLTRPCLSIQLGSQLISRHDWYKRVT